MVDYSALSTRVVIDLATGIVQDGEVVDTLSSIEYAVGTQADDIFVKLMGDIVEPRREFIQANAHNVANLDV